MISLIVAVVASVVTASITGAAFFDRVYDTGGQVRANSCDADNICEVNALLVAEDSVFQDDPRFELGFVSNSPARFFTSSEISAVEIGSIEAEGPILSFVPIQGDVDGVEIKTDNNEVTAINIKENGATTFYGGVLFSEDTLFQDTATFELDVRLGSQPGNETDYICIDRYNKLFRSNAPCA